MPTSATIAELPVYPRVCGGTAIYSIGKEGVTGLSPRVRGNPVTVSRKPNAQRSIPACAGEPQPHSEKNRRASVYPRVCGGTVRSGLFRFPA